MANDKDTKPAAQPGQPGTPRVLADVTTNKPAEPKAEPKRESFNGQKARTGDEERAAYKRRIRRWHKKAMAGLSKDTVDGLLREALTWSKEDTQDEA